MARRIPLNISTVQELSNRLEFELAKIESIARQGYVGKSKLVNPDNSYLFMADGVLQFFNATTNETNPVQLGQ
jgi:hypothetical protein